MIDDLVLGIIAAGVPLLIIGAIALRKLPAVLAFYVALLAVGLGYLGTTGAMKDVGAKVRPHIPAGFLPPATPASPPAEQAPANP